MLPKREFSGALGDTVSLVAGQRHDNRFRRQPGQMAVALPSPLSGGDRHDVLPCVRQSRLDLDWHRLGSGDRLGVFREPLHVVWSQYQMPQ